MALDLIIRGGTVVDGSGKPRYGATSASRTAACRDRQGRGSASAPSMPTV